MAKESYNATAKWVHWLVALIVIPMLFSFYLEDVPKLYQGDLIFIHKSLGMTILILMLIRIVNIIRCGRPPLPQTMPGWEKILSKVVQFSLYLSLILMPISGWMMSTAAGKSPNFWGLGMINFPGVHVDKALSQTMFDMHSILAWIIIGLLIFHIAGAMKHLWIDKDQVVASMLPSDNPKS